MLDNKLKSVHQEKQHQYLDKKCRPTHTILTQSGFIYERLIIKSDFLNEQIYSCSVCQKNVKSDPIQCDLCLLWLHRLCAKLSKYQLKNKSDSNLHFHCTNCSEICPFRKLMMMKLLMLTW